MTLDWCPYIREVCDHWRSASMRSQLLSGAPRVADAEKFLQERGL